MMENYRSGPYPPDFVGADELFDHDWIVKEKVPARYSTGYWN
jgi:hypothetical protein